MCVGYLVEQDLQHLDLTYRIGLHFIRGLSNRLITTISGRARMPEEHKIVTNHHSIRKSEGDWDKSRRGPWGRLTGIRVRRLGCGKAARSTEEVAQRRARREMRSEEKGWHTCCALVAGLRLACGGSVWVDEAGAVQRRQRGSSWRRRSVRRRRGGGLSGGASALTR